MLQCGVPACENHGHVTKLATVYIPIVCRQSRQCLATNPVGMYSKTYYVLQASFDDFWIQ